MNIINVSINFKERKCNVEGVTLTEGDYNSTKMVFDYDVEEGMKVLEMKNRLDEIVYFDEIVDNEVVLVGKAQVIKIENDIKYYKYTDANEAVFWYDKENNKLYDDEMVEVVDFNLDDYDPVLVDASLFTIDGEYTFEVSLYENNSKLTSAYGTIDVAPEQVVFDESQAELIPQILDNLLNQFDDIEQDINDIKDDIIDLDNNKQDTLVSGENIKTINNQSLLGEGDLNIDVPTKLSDLEEDSTHRTVTDTEKTTWNNKSDFSGDYNDLQNKPSIPSKTSDLNNDSGFIDKTVDDLDNYTKTSNLSTVATSGDYRDLSNTPDLSVYVTTTQLGNETTARQNADLGLQNQIDAITSASDVVDVVSTYQDLLDYDTSKLTEDDVIKVMQDSTHSNAISYYRWVSSSWSYIGSEGPFYTKGETDNLLNQKANVSDIPDLTDYVKNTDYATTNNAGVIKASNYYGTAVDGNNGNLKSVEKTYENYTSAASEMFISKGTLENVITGKELTNKTYVDNANALQDTEIQALQEENDYLNSIVDQLPKSTGEGTNVTLNNTIEGKLGIELKSSEVEQFTTTGKNLFDYNKFINNGGATSTREPNKITVVNSNNETNSFAYFLLGKEELLGKTITIHSNMTGTTGGIKLYFGGSTNNIVSGISGKYSPSDSKWTLTIANSFPSNCDRVLIILYSNFSEASSGTTMVFENTQAELGSSVSPYEPYTGGIPAPNPSYPSQVHTITGDNEIKIQNKNLFDGLFKLSAINYDVDYTNTDIERTLNYSDLTSKYYTFGGYFKAGTYTFSIQKENDYYTMNRIAIAGTLCIQSGTHIRNSYTWTQAVDGYTYFALERDDGATSYTDINFDGTNFMLQIEQGSTATTYVEHQEQVKEINLGSLEMCEIGDYKDKFIRNSGKNLFNTATVERGSIGSSGDWGTSGTSSITINGNEVTVTTTTEYRGFYTDWIDAKPNQAYKLSYEKLTSGFTYFSYLYWYDENHTFISRDGGTSSTAPNNTKYMRVMIGAYTQVGTFKTTNIQLEEGSSASEFEPYGKDQWYIKKNIGKVVLDGSETWDYFPNIASSNLFRTPFTGYLKGKIVYSNYYKGVIGSDYRTNFTTYLFEGSANQLDILDNRYTNTEDFKNWLSTHNTITYYVLSPSTYTLLNDTLQNQINDIYYTMKSYKEQTNLSQNNADLGFTIKGSALLDLNSLINS